MADVLVDTSVWIEFFRKHEPWHEVVRELIDAEQVCCVGLVLAELMQGAKSEKELAVLADFPQTFPFLPESVELWAKAGRLSFTLRRKGVTIGLGDCFLAEAAKAAGVRIATLDAHFNLLQDDIAIDLLPVPNP